MTARRISKEVLTLLYIIFFFLLYIAMEDYASTVQSDLNVYSIRANDAFDEEEYNIFIDLNEYTLYLFIGGQLV